MAAKKIASKSAPTAMKPATPSPFQFLKLAKASLDAANAIYADVQGRDVKFNGGDREVEFTFMLIPGAFLYLRTVELALKAAILERGLSTPAEIPARGLGHDLGKLLARATTPGTPGKTLFSLAELGIDQEALAFLDRYSDDYANKWFEYHFGPNDVPELGECQQVATSIFKAIEPIALTL